MSSPSEPVFPPLIQGCPVNDDAFAHACNQAVSGCDAGLLPYRLATDDLQAALVLAPEVPLGPAMAMLPLCGVGLQNALGALAPPELAVHLDWYGTIRVNGGNCGRLRAAAACSDPDLVPDWLVIGFELTRLPPNDHPGETPDHTSLHAEGCGDLSPALLVEAWARHTLHWLNRWESDGPRALHAEWRGLLYDWEKDEDVSADEQFGLLLREGNGYRLIPLTTLLEVFP